MMRRDLGQKRQIDDVHRGSDIGPETPRAGRKRHAPFAVCRPGFFLVAGCLTILLAGCNAWARAGSRGLVINGTAPLDWPADTTAPVAIPLPPDWPSPDALTARITFEGRPTRTVTAQCEHVPGTGVRYAWVMLDVEPEARGRPVTVELTGRFDQFFQPVCLLNYDGRALHVNDIGGQPALAYVHGPPEADAPYPFTQYFHPIFGLDGEVLTDVYPADHRHHRGLFWAWVRHEHEGTSLGNWWIPRNIRSAPDELTFHSGPIFARFQSRHWLVHQPDGGGEEDRFLRDEVTCRIYPPTDNGRAFDIEIALRASRPGIRLGGTTTEDKGYGGLTFRFAPADDVRIVADGTALDDDAIRHRACWADWSGVFQRPDGPDSDGRTSGAAILVHPAHPDYPPQWLLRHYGILNVSFPGLEMREIPTDKPLVLRYRVWIHRGDAEAGSVQEQYLAYAADWQWEVSHGAGAAARASRSTADGS